MMDGSTIQLSPLDHIKGNLHRFLPAERRHERDKWCRDMREAGFTCKQIGAALGLKAAMVHKHSQNAGYNRAKDKINRPVSRAVLRNNGYRFGNAADTFNAVSVPLQHAVVAYCRKHDCTILQAALAMLEEKMTGHAK
jgi:hypothetical protein